MTHGGRAESEPNHIVRRKEAAMLEIRNLSYDVQEGNASKEIIQNISLTIEDGTFTVITGPNGGGKSTLAKLIMGILTPSAGQIIYNGLDVTGLPIEERAKLGMSFAFQQPIRFKGLTVRDLLQLAAGRDISTCEACGYLSEVGLCAMDYIDRELDASLSGGELKRIEIAMLIARGTQLCIFDEPEAGIDLWSFQNLINVFEKMRDQGDSSVIIISHQERILSIANQLVVLSAGKIEQVGNRKELLPGLLAGADPNVCERGVQLA